MDPIKPINQSPDPIQQHSNPTDQNKDPQFDTSVTTPSTHTEQASEQWELGINAHTDQYMQGIQKLLHAALVDQSYENTRISILISTIAFERMRSDPEFESLILNSLYNGTHAAFYLVIPAYLILKVHDNGTVESSSGNEETMSEFEEEIVHAFWTQQPINATLSGTESWHAAHEYKPKTRPKLNRKSIMAWLEKRKQQFRDKQQALYDYLASIGRRPRDDSDDEHDN